MLISVRFKRLGVIGATQALRGVRTEQVGKLVGQADLLRRSPKEILFRGMPLGNVTRELVFWPCPKMMEVQQLA